MAAAKRAAMVHNAFLILVGFVHHLGIERMAQRIGYRALELGVERSRSECRVAGLAPRRADCSRSERGA